MNPDIIHALEVAAIVVAGTLTGSELAVAVFFHPCISRLEDAVHIRAAQPLAKVLGMAMSFWYPVTFLLTLTVTFVAHTVGSTPWCLALASTVLLALISVYSLLLPVPINNQVARWQPDSVPPNWRDLRRRWDLLHAIRVVFLIIAFILLVASCVYSTSRLTMRWSERRTAVRSTFEMTSTLPPRATRGLARRRSSYSR